MHEDDEVIIVSLHHRLIHIEGMCIFKHSWLMKIGLVDGSSEEGSYL